MADDQREALLETGVALAHARGFGATGVREITAAAGVPQGSFTNHFRSKEAFGVLLLDRYSARIEGIMRETLENEALPPEERLIGYFDRIAANAAALEWQRGCLVADLSAEIASHGEALRAGLQAALERQSARFEAAVAAVFPGNDSDLGAVLLAAWHGTLLRTKVEQTPTAIDRFRRVLAALIAARQEG
ncbi:TetR/AcrR family transcriptional repressor of nem operon [Sphingomonas zeicaulis]|uniref:TetR/AcrR family transcriptional regulator n=1 Tax=Sphingomonas zeicaulis TaxID=1632740 RepID=UPI003D256EB6